MADDVIANVDFGELEKALGELMPRAARRSIRRAGIAGGEILKAAIEAAAPQPGHSEGYATGFLASEFQVTSRAGSGGDEDTTGSIRISVGPDPKAGRVKLEGEGKSLHSKGSVHWAALEARFKELGTKHQEARPFMAPTAEQNAGRVVDGFGNELSSELEKLKK